MAIPISLLLILGISAVATITGTARLSLCLSPFLLPALLGALIFREDQRPGHRDFLATHAARPRYVWLARQLVGLTLLILIGATIHAIGWFSVGFGYQQSLEDVLRYHNYQRSLWSTVQYFQEMTTLTWQVTLLGWCALFAAYGIGQLCSMLLRREVLAGFLALLFAPLLTAWTLLVGVWQLSPVWFILPIGLVTLWATWLRAPAWILGRHHIASWLKPLAALTIPLAYLLLTLPAVRLAQLNEVPVDYPFLQEPLEASLEQIESKEAEARQTATAYEQLYTSLEHRGTISLPMAEKIAELSNRPCQFPVEIISTGSKSWNQFFVFKTCLLAEAQQLQQNGDLHKARERYFTLFRLDGQALSGRPTNGIVLVSYDRNNNKLITDAFLSWAQHPDQTSDNLKSTIIELQRIYQDYPKPRDAVVADYRYIRDVILEKQLPTFL